MEIGKLTHRLACLYVVCALILLGITFMIGELFLRTLADMSSERSSIVAYPIPAELLSEIRT